jgi:hypothetical protein
MDNYKIPFRALKKSQTTNEKDPIQSKETKKVKKRDSMEKVNTDTRGIIMQGQRKI